MNFGSRNLIYSIRCDYRDTHMTVRVQLLSLSMILSDTTIIVYILDVHCDDHMTGQLCSN